MRCGVVAIVDPCDADFNKCKINHLCEKATKGNNGKTFWNNAGSSSDGKNHYANLEIEQL